MCWQLPEGLKTNSTVMQALCCFVSSHACCEPSESSANPLTFPSACPGLLATSCATSHGAGSSTCLGCLAERQQPVRHASSDPPRPQQVSVTASGSACSRAETPRAPSSLLSSAASPAGSAQAIADADYIAEETLCEGGTPSIAPSKANVAAAVLMDAAEAINTTSEACAEPAAGAILHVSRSSSGTSGGHSQRNNAELCATTAAIDSTSGTNHKTAEMASASSKRNNAPARPQQAYHLSSYQEEKRKPWLEQQAAEQSVGGSQHTAGSTKSTQQEPLLQPWRIAAQPQALSLPLRRDGGGVPGTGAQQASRADVCNAPEARPASPSLMLASQGPGLGQQAAPLSPPQAAAWTDGGGGSARGQAEPSQPVALADSAVMKIFDQPAGAMKLGQDVADRVKEGGGLCGATECSIAGEEDFRLAIHAACQAKENICLDMLDSRQQSFGSTAFGINEAKVEAAVAQGNADIGDDRKSISQAMNELGKEIQSIGQQDNKKEAQSMCKVEDAHTSPGNATGQGSTQTNADRLASDRSPAPTSNDSSGLSQGKEYDEPTWQSSNSTTGEQQAATDRLSTSISSTAADRDISSAPHSHSQQEDWLSSRMRCFLASLEGRAAAAPDAASTVLTSGLSMQAEQGFTANGEMAGAKVTCSRICSSVLNV